MILAMIPARMGSQRLKQKNLRELQGVPLIARAVRKCREAGVFDQIWVNSEHPAFGDVARREGVFFHQRPEELGSNTATSEQFVYEFLTKRPCDYLVQVHSIAPLLTSKEVADFVTELKTGRHDALMSVVNEQLECVFNSQPVNFTFAEKTNSQDLTPVQRITWCITGWNAAAYMAAYEGGKCATYAGRVGYYPVSRESGHVIKTEADLKMAAAMLEAMEMA